ncbi:MAG: alcohol dehydrogenase catalytic domain-containing protein [Acidobacteriia bacterium]|nr:alcohol dehydrogenase catalytic domain-containing protein [Terriglobia bacterium]
MRAAILEEYGRVETKEVAIPQPPAGEILLKVLGCGVCGTDVHLASGEVPLARPPVVLGHEIAAEVYAVAGGEGFERGEHVVVDPVIGCGHCRWCRQGLTNLCVSPTIVGYVRSGGFCQYMSVPARQIYRVPARFSPKDGILVETLACVLHGYDRLAPRPGSSVLIMGAGTVGLLWLQLIKHSLTTFVMQTDLVESRVATAKKLGADITGDISSTEPADLLGHHGISDFDIIIDATGNPVALTSALPFLGKGGTCMFFGVCPEDAHIQISPYEMFLKEQTLIASKMPPKAFDQAIALLAAGVINTEALVNRVLALDQAGDALRMFVEEKDKGIKMMINPWSGG